MRESGDPLRAVEALLERLVRVGTNENGREVVEGLR